MDEVDPGSGLPDFCIVLPDAQSGIQTCGNPRSFDHNSALISQFRDKGGAYAVEDSARLIYDWESSD